GAVMGVVLGLVRRLSPLLFVWRTLLFGAIGLVIGVMLYGNGALPTSLAVVCIASPTCTFLGLVFALLGQRSRLAGLRRCLAVLSILPIITPPFILAFSMIFLLGRRGLVTYNVFDLSTNWIYGVPGVAIAQILAFTPVAYLLLRGSLGALNPALEEASQTLGARPLVGLKTITWPLVRPGLAAACPCVLTESAPDSGPPSSLAASRRALPSAVRLSLAGWFIPRAAPVYGPGLRGLFLLAFCRRRLRVGGGSFITVTGKPSSG